MRDVFVNLKRFEVSRRLGGVCPQEDPIAWIKTVIRECFELGLADQNDVRLTCFVPEALLDAAVSSATSFAGGKNANLNIGCQGVFRENISPGGNLGAFTTSFPAVAAQALGCTWSIIGHSEERKAKLGIIRAYEPLIDQDEGLKKKATAAIDGVINEEVLRALESKLNVLLCVGETAQERGEGGFTEQKPRIEKTLRQQLITGLQGVTEHLESRELVIGYEPIWAIGPGKTPPDEDYIAYVAQLIKDIVVAEFHVPVKVVYGGGLKKENAASLGALPVLDGGLVALTNFSGEIGFEPSGLKEIIDEFIKGDHLNETS